MSKTETKTVDRVLESLAKIRDLKVNSKEIENAVKSGNVKASADGKWVPREPEALADGDVLLHIDGEIYPGVAAQSREKYELIDPQSHLVVKINSPGGSVEEMAEMYAIIAQHPGQTTGYVIGQASSAASALLQAFDTRVMDPLSVQMIHEVSPHERDVRAFLERVIFANDMLVDIYVSRNTADLTEERVREMFRDGDKRYKPAEAVELGFADMVALPREAEQEAEADEPVATGWTMSSDSDIDRMLDYIAEGVAAICARANKPNTAADSRDGSNRNSDSANESETTTGVSNVLDAYLKANGLTDDQIAALTDAQRAAFQKTFDGESVEIEDKQPAGNDGATEMGGKLASDLDAVFISRTKLHAKIKAELGEWPELVEKAITDGWDEKDIRIAKLEQERTTSTAGSGAGFSAITSDGSEKDLDQEKVVLCAFESSIGVDYKSLSDPWGDLNAEQRRQLGSELTNFEAYDEATIEAALKLKRRCPGGKVGIKELANLALGRSVHSGSGLAIGSNSPTVQMPKSPRSTLPRSRSMLSQPA